MPIRGIKEDEFERLNELLEASYKHAEIDHRFINLYKQKPLKKDWGRIFEYDPLYDTGLKISDKRFVAHCGIYDQNMQYGRSFLKNGGIKDVASHPICRGKGFGLLVMEEAQQFMFDQEVDISILFSGANHFYEKLGWRGGIRTPSFKMSESIFNKWTQWTPNFTEFDSSKIEIKTLEAEDLPKISELYNQSLSGQYFAGLRTEDYWKRHLDTHPNWYWEYLIVEIEGQILAAIRFELTSKGHADKHNQTLVVNESLHAQSIAIVGSPVLSIIYQHVLTFLKEEALNQGDKITEIIFNLSENNPIVPHLYHAGFSLEDISGMSLSTMFLITNPYSLFKKLYNEYQARAVNGTIPEGDFWIEFDKSGKFPGGCLISNHLGEIIINITKETNQILSWKEIHPLGCSFNTISDLTLYFANILRIEEMEEDDLDGIERMQNIFPWMIGLFSGITYDQYKMDHY